MSKRAIFSVSFTSDAVISDDEFDRIGIINKKVLEARLKEDLEAFITEGPVEITHFSIEFDDIKATQDDKD